MDELLQMLHHYRTARGRMASGFGDEADHTTSVAFGPLLGELPPWHGLDPHSTRSAKGHPVTIASPMGFLPGRLRGLTGAGALVASDAKPGLGTRCVLRVDDGFDHTYLFPAVVSMVEDADAGCLALIFDGSSELAGTQELRGWATAYPVARRRSRGTPPV